MARRIILAEFGDGVHRTFLSDTLGFGLATWTAEGVFVSLDSCPWMGGRPSQRGIPRFCVRRPEGVKRGQAKCLRRGQAKSTIQ
jgi:hypothetical protein